MAHNRSKLAVPGYQALVVVKEGMLMDNKTSVYKEEYKEALYQNNQCPENVWSPGLAYSSHFPDIKYMNNYTHVVLWKPADIYEHVVLQPWTK